MTLAEIIAAAGEDHVEQLRSIIERWQADGVTVTAEDLQTAIARHQRVQDLQRKDRRR